MANNKFSPYLKQVTLLIVGTLETTNAAQLSHEVTVSGLTLTNIDTVFHQFDIDGILYSSLIENQFEVVIETDDTSLLFHQYTVQQQNTTSLFNTFNVSQENNTVLFNTFNVAVPTDDTEILSNNFDVLISVNETDEYSNSFDVLIGQNTTDSIAQEFTINTIQIQQDFILSSLAISLEENKNPKILYLKRVGNDIVPIVLQVSVSQQDGEIENNLQLISNFSDTISLSSIQANQFILIKRTSKNKKAKVVAVLDTGD